MERAFSTIPPEGGRSASAPVVSFWPWQLICDLVLQSGVEVPVMEAGGACLFSPSLLL